MGDAVGKPAEDVQYSMMVFCGRREDVADVCTVEYAFKCRKNADPDGRAVVGPYESAQLVSTPVQDEIHMSRWRSKRIES